MRIRTPFPYETTHDDVRIPLPDGTLLYARVWRPLTQEPVPAILEYLPYRLTDWTAPRDGQRHPWYAGHGYASVRVDVRGHGNSEGLPGDAYSAAELADGVEVVDWLAAQPWCDGRVGMFGISWGGFDALRIAALAPEPLKAVVTVCATDDRYDNDVHYLGGSVLAADMHAWAATMLAYVSRPPDPLHVGDGWREMWLARLEAVEPFVHTWLGHQTRDGYWRHGSVREDHDAIGAAVLAVGGWHDPYHDTVLRLVEHLPADRVRGIVGPWSHQYPDRGLPPGPAIGFLQETLRWWDQHLKGVDTGVMREPLLRAYIGDSHPPATVLDTLPGRWVGEPAWPSPHVTTVAYGLQGAPVLVRSPQHTGVDAGRFRPVGNDADLPPDQREEDARSACFEFATGEETWVLGRPRVRLRVTSEVSRGQVVARLCDVAPDGSSTLVTRGVLNLSARHGQDRTVPWEPGATQEVAFELNGIGHAFPPGHRIRLAVSSAYWPWIWPQPGSQAGFTLEPAGSFLELPVRAREAASDIAFEEPEQSGPLDVTRGVAADGWSPATLDEPRPERLVVRDVAKGEWRLEVDPRYGGTRVYPDGLEITEDALETYTIDEQDPLSARTRSDWTIRLHRPELAWDTTVRTRAEITCDRTDFHTSDEVVCTAGDEVVFHRTWEKRIPRTAG
ncbi:MULTISPECIES: CocE/NonD family hydrolase [Streptomyces]|uniref:Peptidase S15 n=1 Tax=Streptomyces sviceus (strain ATCC 29083 / DSM 924 / JCM 4929 / NBRC 13980 / NCIMB 11184 / NRRL 5439 / UC 5370) TaxID=463191 RepID=B5HQA1_STRX2|nr:MULTISPECIES: CocE/NonD family hydrolase [Streptomyces]EDY55006.1 peptidase S15 [Streptomyces sviceus ATCC 29083]MYT07717.1 CocE/NonD family hydrolase [Streptomyces sp. SID5470]